ncbi:MAG: T9SS type A sorting domain-containing protein, partial [Bacteroidales bacterium]|nr:T9SS type A sorting domain-containing protein [Bacteroidales bacterium]
HELDGSNGLDAFPHFGAVDDYLHQAADWNNWPDDIVYDPNDDGVLIPSMGVHEHWNNPVERLYSRNLGMGDGIEMIFIDGVQDPVTGVHDNLSSTRDIKVLVYPNPATSFINIRFSSDFIGKVGVSIIDINGRLTKQLTHQKLSGVFNEVFELSKFKKGVYFFQISENETVYTVKFIVE